MSQFPFFHFVLSEFEINIYVNTQKYIHISILFNVYAIYSHGISFEKNSLTTKGLGPASSVIGQQPCYPLDYHAFQEKEA